MYAKSIVNMTSSAGAAAALFFALVVINKQYVALESKLSLTNRTEQCPSDNLCKLLYFTSKSFCFVSAVAFIIRSIAVDVCM